MRLLAFVHWIYSFGLPVCWPGSPQSPIKHAEQSVLPLSLLFIHMRMLMWETDLVQTRSDRAWLPWSYISSQMGIETREFCHVPFVVSNKCFCYWCGKSFSSFVTFALGWALASQRSITIQFGLGTSDPCYWLARLLLLNRGGLFSSLLL